MKRAYQVWGISCLVFALTFVGCYSFTGSSIPSHLHTIGIPLASDNSGFGQSNIRQDLTSQLVTKFTRDGSLQVRDRSVADVVLEVTISTITDQAVAVRQGDQLTNKRVTISVEATYKDQVKQKTIWERGFSQTADYAISGGLDALNNAIKQAEDKLSDDLLLGVISNW